MCAESLLWRNMFRGLANAPLSEKLEFKRLQESAMDSAVEDEVVPTRPTRRLNAKQPAVASFARDNLFKTPSAFIKHLLSTIPAEKQLTRSQTLFIVQFAAACDNAWADEQKPPEQRRTHHMLLLGAGGTGKTHVVQNVVFKTVEYLWPAESVDSPSLMVVAASNAQAKNISSPEFKARTLHNAAGMRVQEMVNPKMRPGDKANALEQRWRNVRVLVIEEVSMVSAASYNMLDFRAMYGRTKTHAVTESTYKKKGCSFGRCPIVIHLGDFLQLSPTGQLSLVADVNAKREDGSYVLAEPPTLEIQNAIRVFKEIECVIELQGTKRFVQGDPLIKFLACMRSGSRIPTPVWKAFEKTFATDSHPGKAPALDPRHAQQEFLEGYGLAMYWETLARWITRRARRDARVLEVPLVFLQASDECHSLGADAYSRLLNVANIHKTGRIHGVLPIHVGMRVRFTGKFNGAYGLVQEQKATVVDFVFHEDDARRYRETGPGEFLRPRRLPTGVWLQVDDFADSPTWASLKDHVSEEKLARGLYCMPLMEAVFTWEASNEAHSVKRFGFMLTHAHYLTTTASQGQTIRAAVTIDCARNEPQGNRGTNDDAWWLNLYVMFSRVTKMADMLLLRPPPRELLERGPPASVRAALQRFERVERDTVAGAILLAVRLGIALPDE